MNNFKNYDTEKLEFLRKYIYGARVGEPVCMIDVADNTRPTTITSMAWVPWWP